MIKYIAIFLAAIISILVYIGSNTLIKRQTVSNKDVATLDRLVEGSFSREETGNNNSFSDFADSGLKPVKKGESGLDKSAVDKIVDTTKKSDISLCQRDITLKTGYQIDLKKSIEIFRNRGAEHVICSSSSDCIEIKDDTVICGLQEGKAVVSANYLDIYKNKKFTIEYNINIVKGKEVAISVPRGYAEDVLKYTNEYRIKHRLKPLRLHPKLNQIAMQRSKDITYYYSHTLRSGEPTVFNNLKFDDIYTKEEKKELAQANGGKLYFKTGENIACGQATAKAVVDSWYESPGHRENILNPYACYLGVGCVYNDKVVTKNNLKEISKTMVGEMGSLRYATKDDMEAKNRRIYWCQIFG